MTSWEIYLRALLRKIHYHILQTIILEYSSYKTIK